MNIVNMTIENIADLMGSEATMDEAKEMMVILIDSGEVDTDDITDNDWREMIANAVEIVEQLK